MADCLQPAANSIEKNQLPRAESGAKEACAKMSESQEKENDLDRPVWGIVAIAKIIGRNPRQAHYPLTRSLIDADQIGGRMWVSTRRRLLGQFKGKAA